MERLLRFSFVFTMLLQLPIPRSATAQASRPPQDSNFGNFDANVSRCTMNRHGTIQNCSRVQLTQRGRAGLRIRFSGPGEEPGTSTRVTFIASHPSGEPALVCDRGSCEPSTQAWSARVISGSTAQFNGRGLPNNLPKAQSMRGTCRVSKDQISCQSQTRNGWTLSAEARL